MAANITSFFGRVDGPLPIHWTSSAEPPKKKAKREAVKVQQPLTIDSDSEHEQSEQENEVNVD